jgi:hypothetical protein
MWPPKLQSSELDEGLDEARTTELAAAGAPVKRLLIDGTDDTAPKREKAPLFRGARRARLRDGDGSAA